MNVKFELRVTRKALESWLQYVRESGYEVTEKKTETEFLHEIVYHAYIPGRQEIYPLYGPATPLALSMKIDRRWQHWIFTRIPLADQP